MFQTIRILKNLWLQPKKGISESLVLMAEFIDSHGRFPRNSAETPEELRLYRFLVVNSAKVVRSSPYCQQTSEEYI